ncbi:zinc finger protein 318-like isoform X2 [Clupea harengus]|uniref:Zinc finger protein 318-like isoform X2 n=1 Tax=Clupea harengus TaxID=7950 RepID=A0A6P8F3D6_CLUHA|nr:zinc finger protein 318-like isoform X2 [Clupea harengus]
MESGKGWTLPQEQICKDKKAVPRQQSSSSPPAVMARDASYNNEPEDEELARKRRELYLIEEQISRKRTNIALKNNDLQRTPQYREKDDKNEEENEEWDNEIKVETEHERSPLFTNNNFPQRPPHQEAARLTERQISTLNELTQPFVSFEASDPAPSSFMKGFVQKRNAEIFQRDLEQKHEAQSDLKATFTPEHRVEALRPHRHSGHALPSPASKSPAEQADPFSGPLLKGFDHFLSVLNQGVDVQRLSEIVNEAQAEVVNNKPAAPIRGETCRSVDVDDKKYRESKDKEKGSKRKIKDSRYGNSPSRDKDRQSRDSRERDRGWDLREEDMNLRHKKLESKDDCRDSEHRGSISKMGDGELGNRDRNVRNKDKDTNDLRQDSLSPRRRCSRDRRSRSRSSSSISSSSEDERKMEKKEHLSRVQTLLQIVGLDLGIEGLDRLRGRTQEMLHGTKHPRGRGDGRQRRRRHRDSSWSESLHDSSPDSHHRRHDSQKHRGSHGTERPRRVSETNLTQSVQEVTGSYPISPAPQNMPVSTFSQPPLANYSSYTAMYHNSYDGQDHSASVQSWTAVGWSGVPPPGPPCSYGPPLGNILPGTPQFTPPPLMVTGSHNAPYQLPPPQYPTHLGPPPLLPASQPPRHLLPPPQFSCQLPPPPHLLPPPHPPLLPPSHLPPPLLPPSHLPPPLLPPPHMPPPTPPQPPPHLPPPPHLHPPPRPLLPNPSFPPSAYPLLPSTPPPPPKQVTAAPNLRVAEMQGSSEKDLTAADLPPFPQECEPPWKSGVTSTDYALLCSIYPKEKRKTKKDIAAGAAVCSPAVVAAAKAACHAALPGGSEPAAKSGVTHYKKCQELIVASFSESQTKPTKRELRYLAWRVTKKAKKAEKAEKAVCTCYGYGCRHCGRAVTAPPAKLGRTLKGRQKVAKAGCRRGKWTPQKAALDVAGTATATATAVASAGTTGDH